MIAVGLLVAPTALLVETSLGAVTAGVAIAVVSGLVSVLMLIRLTMTGRAYQRRAAREHAGRLASQAMVSATTDADVVAGTRSALHRVLPGGRAVGVEMIRPGVDERLSVGPVPREGAAELVLPLRGTECAMVFTAPPNELYDLTELLSSLTDQAALALQRIGLIEAARAEERERYFRTLVLTSTDVILISRGGQIEYATPSAEAMFGRVVLGFRLEDLVRPVTEAGPAPADGGDGPLWPDVVDGAEGVITRPDREVAVLVHRRDLTDDATVHGVVTTLRDITAERRLQRDLAYRANHDELTGLANGRLFGRSLDEEQERRIKRGNGTAVLFIDLDDFKSINDSYGHGAGNEVLAEVGRRIRASIRAEDLAARVGGDEFAVLLRGIAHVDDARAVAQRVAEALAEPAWVDGDPVDCRASIGLAFTQRRERVEGLTGQADVALYRAKADGKGIWREYVPGMRGPRRRRREGVRPPPAIGPGPTRRPGRP
jgi:diguanylate cyclase (GGDEF)-like protein